MEPSNKDTQKAISSPRPSTGTRPGPEDALVSERRVFLGCPAQQTQSLPQPSPSGCGLRFHLLSPTTESANISQVLTQGHRTELRVFSSHCKRGSEFRSSLQEGPLPYTPALGAQSFRPIGAGRTRHRCLVPWEWEWEGVLIPGSRGWETFLLCP